MKRYEYVNSVRGTEDFFITGNMYHIRYQKGWIVLEELLSFLPVTNAEVFTISNKMTKFFLLSLLIKNTYYLRKREQPR